MKRAYLLHYSESPSITTFSLWKAFALTTAIGKSRLFLEETPGYQINWSLKIIAAVGIFAVKVGDVFLALSDLSSCGSPVNEIYIFHTIGLLPAFPWGSWSCLCELVSELVCTIFTSTLVS